MPKPIRHAMTDNRERILQERHNLLMNEVGSRMILSFCIAAALPLFFMDMLREPSFFGWYALLLCVGIQSFAITRFYNGNRDQESQKTGKWHRINLYLALIWAILWSAFPYLFLQGHQPCHLADLPGAPIHGHFCAFCFHGCLPGYFYQLYHPGFSGLAGFHPDFCSGITPYYQGHTYCQPALHGSVQPLRS